MLRFTQLCPLHVQLLDMPCVIGSILIFFSCIVCVFKHVQGAESAFDYLLDQHIWNIVVCCLPPFNGMASDCRKNNHWFHTGLQIYLKKKRLQYPRSFSLSMNLFGTEFFLQPGVHDNILAHLDRRFRARRKTNGLDVVCSGGHSTQHSVRIWAGLYFCKPRYLRPHGVLEMAFCGPGGSRVCFASHAHVDSFWLSSKKFLEFSFNAVHLFRRCS